MDASVVWKNEGLVFEGTADTGGVVGLASSMDQGSAGFRPMELMGLSLAGCTGMDVLSILKKKRQAVTAFEVKVHTRAADDHPHVWTQVHVEYVITGSDIDPKAVERAMELSANKYCPAQNMLKQAVAIELTYTIIPN